MRMTLLAPVLLLALFALACSGGSGDGPVATRPEADEAPGNDPSTAPDDASPTATVEPGTTATPRPTRTPQPTRAATDDAVLSIDQTFVPLELLRRDLADRLVEDGQPIELLDVVYEGFQHADWPDGCIGVYSPGVDCAGGPIAGYIVLFRVGGGVFRYHVAGDGFVATDFIEGDPEIDDGQLLQPELRVDVGRLFAAYARDDLALRLGLEGPDEVAILALDFVADGTKCGADGAACPDGVMDVAAIRLLAGTDVHHYFMADYIHFADPEPDQRLAGAAIPREEVAEIQADMRRRLAREVNFESDEISVVSYREALWPDGCTGVYRPDSACIQGAIPGFVAFLETPDGSDFRFHGHLLTMTFIATEFEPEGTEILPPLLPGE